MNEDMFWEVIASFNLEEEGNDSILGPALEKLVSMTVEDIKQFAEILAEKLYAIDGPAYAANVYLDGYLSPEYFLYIRCYVVANGKDMYYHVLNNPSAMPDDIGLKILFHLESLLYLAGDAYNKKQNTDGVYIETKLSYETGSNVELWKQ